MEQIKSESPEGTGPVGSQGQSLEEVTFEQRPEVVWERACQAAGRAGAKARSPEGGAEGRTQEAGAPGREEVMADMSGEGAETAPEERGLPTERSRMVLQAGSLTDLGPVGSEAYWSLPFAHMRCWINIC